MTDYITRPVELLAPAGSTEALDAAIAEGADAVYLGLKSFNARLRTSNFSWSQFEAATRILHKKGRKIYVTVNTVFEQREADRMYQFLKYLASVGPDGIIVQDFGVARMAREYFPSLSLHASTQMNIASARAANLLSKQGFSRVVVARELNLPEIQDIRASSNVQLEVFVHGALCVSESGLCLFSSYLGGKSANRGMCTQACRRRYEAGRAGESEKEFGSFRMTEDVSDDVTLGDGASGYFFSPSDLQLLEDVPALAAAGVSSFKIEGRMKSAEYVGTVVSAYRYLLDSMDGDCEAALNKAKQILKQDFARPKTRFFYDNEGSPNSWLDPRQAGGTGIPLGQILEVRGGGENRQGLLEPETIMPEELDSARFHKADDSDRKSLKLQRVDESKNGKIWISIPEGFSVGDLAYLIQTRSMTRRYVKVLPKDLSTFRRQPGHDSLPYSAPLQNQRKSITAFPEGLYVACSRIEDMYVIQSVKPTRIILRYTISVIKRLLETGGDPLPFSKDAIIIALDPWFPQAQEEQLAQEIPELIACGYRNFIINNLGQVSLFRGTDASVIAGEYLYTFNSKAREFIDSLGLDYTVTPLENSRQNLDKSVAAELRPYTFVTVFAWPPLFRIRADLSSIYSFRYFSDARGEEFLMDAGRDGTFVYPSQPFSIVDKIAFLRSAGFSRFILDFSGPVLKKKDYRDVMSAAETNASLVRVTRFNWKDGFFSTDAPPRAFSEGSDAGSRGDAEARGGASRGGRSGDAGGRGVPSRGGRASDAGGRGVPSRGGRSGDAGGRGVPSREGRSKDSRGDSGSAQRGPRSGAGRSSGTGYGRSGSSNPKGRAPGGRRPPSGRSR